MFDVWTICWWTSKCEIELEMYILWRYSTLTVQNGSENGDLMILIIVLGALLKKYWLKFYYYFNNEKHNWIYSFC